MNIYWTRTHKNWGSAQSWRSGPIFTKHLRWKTRKNIFPLVFVVWIIWKQIYVDLCRIGSATYHTYFNWQCSLVVLSFCQCANVFHRCFMNMAPCWNARFGLCHSRNAVSFYRTYYERTVDVVKSPSKRAGMVLSSAQRQLRR